MGRYEHSNEQKHPRQTARVPSRATCSVGQIFVLIVPHHRSRSSCWKTVWQEQEKYSWWWVKIQWQLSAWFGAQRLRASFPPPLSRAPLEVISWGEFYLPVPELSSPLTNDLVELAALAVGSWYWFGSVSFEARQKFQ
jgi:hypothetical protein